MTLQVLGPVRQGGGALFVAIGAPGVAVVWALTGPGTLTPTSDRTDGAGVASARYDAGAAVAGQSITVRAEAHA
jgi:hypothetical protein